MLRQSSSSEEYMGDPRQDRHGGDGMPTSYFGGPISELVGAEAYMAEDPVEDDDIVVQPVVWL